MDEEFDVYGDLDEFDLQTQKNEVERENIELKKRLEEVESKVTQLAAERDKIAREHEASLRNFSSLVETARMELGRKERHIKEERKNYDDLCFRRKVRPNLKVTMLSKSIQTDFDVSAYPWKEDSAYTESKLYLTNEESQLNTMASKSKPRHEYREYEHHHRERDKINANKQSSDIQHSVFDKYNDMNGKLEFNSAEGQVEDSHHRQRVRDRGRKYSSSGKHNNIIEKPEFTATEERTEDWHHRQRERNHSSSVKRHELNGKPVSNDMEERMKDTYHRHRTLDQDRKHLSTGKHTTCNEKPEKSNCKDMAERIEDSYHQQRVSERRRRHSLSAKHNDNNEKSLFNDADERKEYAHSRHRDSPKKERNPKAKSKKRSRSKTRNKDLDDQRHSRKSKERDRLRKNNEKSHPNEDDHIRRNADDLRDKLKRKRNVESDGVSSRHRSSKKSRLDSNENISKTIPKDFATEMEPEMKLEMENIADKYTSDECPGTPPKVELPSDAEEGEIVTPTKHISKVKYSQSPSDPVQSITPRVIELGTTEICSVPTKSNGYENTTLSDNDSLWNIAITPSIDGVHSGQNEQTEKSIEMDSIKANGAEVSANVQASSSADSLSENRKRSRKHHDTPKKHGKHRTKSERKEMSKEKQFDEQDIMYANLYDDIEISFISHKELPCDAQINGTDIESIESNIFNDGSTNCDELPQVKTDDRSEMTTPTSLNTLITVNAPTTATSPTAITTPTAAATATATTIPFSATTPTTATTPTAATNATATTVSFTESTPTTATTPTVATTPTTATIPFIPITPTTATTNQQHDKPKKHDKHIKQDKYKKIAKENEKEFDEQDIMYANLYDDLEISFVSHKEEPQVASINGTDMEFIENNSCIESVTYFVELPQEKSNVQPEIVTPTTAITPTITTTANTTTTLITDPLPQENMEPPISDSVERLSTPCIPTDQTHLDETSPERISQNPTEIQAENINNSETDKSDVLNISLGNNDYRIDTLNGEATFITIMSKKRKKKKKTK